MAQVPYQPFPTVPAEGVPARAHDYLDVQASPDAFGAQVGGALARTGGQIQQGAEDVFHAQLVKAQLTNELFANDANTQAMKQYTDLYSDYSKLEGQAAVAARPKFINDIEDVYKRTLASAPNMQSRVMLARSLRYMTDAYGRYATNYADTQWRQWQDKSAVEGAREFGNQAALAMNDPTDMRMFLNSSDDQIRKRFEQAGWDQNSIHAEVAKNRGQNLKNIVEQMALEDPMKAEGVFKAYEKEIDAGSRLQISSKLDPLVKQIQAKAIASAYMGSNLPNPAGKFSDEQIATAIHGQESGGRANAPTSVAGAVGGWQINTTRGPHGEPSTWDLYAKAGEKPETPADNEAVGKRIVSDLSQRFDGDPARVAVGYFSGPGNVAPTGSPTPWIADKADATGKTTSSYVSDVTNRLGTLSKAGIKFDEATAFANVDKDYANNPAMARYIKAELHQQYATATMQAAAAESQQREANNNAANGYVTDILTKKKDPTQIMNGIANDPNLNWETRWRLSEMAQHGTTNEEHDLKTYGPGFYKAFQAVHAAEGDPNRITDINQLYSRVGPQGDLTIAGVHELQNEMAAKKTPEGESEATMRKQFLELARSQISGKNEFMHVADPKGEALLLQFMQKAFPTIDKLKSGGMSYDKIYGSDGEATKLIQQFKRPMAVWQKDLFEANMGVQAPEGTDLSTKEGIQKAWAEHKITKEMAGEAFTAIGTKWRDAPPPPPVAVPATGGAPVPVQ